MLSIWRAPIRRRAALRHGSSAGGGQGALASEPREEPQLGLGLRSPPPPRERALPAPPLLRLPRTLAPPGLRSVRSGPCRSAPCRGPRICPVIGDVGEARAPIGRRRLAGANPGADPGRNLGAALGGARRPRGGDATRNRPLRERRSPPPVRRSRPGARQRGESGASDAGGARRRARGHPPRRARWAPAGLPPGAPAGARGPPEGRCGGLCSKAGRPPVLGAVH